MRSFTVRVRKLDVVKYEDFWTKVEFLVKKNRKFGQKSKFLSKNLNFGRKSKLWTKIVILDENLSCGRKSKFWTTIKIFVNKSKFWTKIEIFYQQIDSLDGNRNFC